MRKLLLVESIRNRKYGLWSLFGERSCFLPQFFGGLKHVGYSNELCVDQSCIHMIATYHGWLRNPAPVENGGKHPIIYRVSKVSTILLVQDFAGPSPVVWQDDPIHWNPEKLGCWDGWSWHFLCEVLFNSLKNQELLFDIYIYIYTYYILYINSYHINHTRVSEVQAVSLNFYRQFHNVSGERVGRILDDFPRVQHILLSKRIPCMSTVRLTEESQSCSLPLTRVHGGCKHFFSDHLWAV